MVHAAAIGECWELSAQHSDRVQVDLRRENGIGGAFVRDGHNRPGWVEHLLDPPMVIPL